MTERLTIDFTPAEGAVVRMIGLVERRGEDDPFDAPMKEATA